MKKVEFDDNVTKILGSEKHRIFSTEGYVGDKTYKISLFGVKEVNKRAVYVTVSGEEDVLICMKDIRSDIDTKNAEKTLEDLCKRMKKLVGPTGQDVECAAVISTAENADMLSQPLMVKITGVGIVKEEKQRMSICAEMNDWLDELLVMMVAKTSEKSKEDYQKEYASIMSGAYLPKKNEEESDYSSVMAIVTLVLTILGAVFHDNLLFPVMGLMAGGFSSYRCIVNKNTKAIVVCVICVVACIVLTYIAWNAMKSGMKLPTKAD